ncbi:hypothetical protein C8Q80DRAFT_435203 [Daedaleopsis nitida]|nr:hypothetical protein C8Q80DRAFT_435203 [Daedaleopsis nitida]
MHTLCLCSLVSRLWNATACRHILSNITLPSKSHKPSRIPDHPRAVRLGELVEANPNLSSCVRTLHLVYKGYQFSYYVEECCFGPTWKNVALGPHLTRFDNVRHVTFSEFTGDSLSPMARVL